LAKVHARLADEAKIIPRSNGSRWYEPLPVRVAIITDEYMFNYYKDSFEEVYWLKPDTWEEVFKNERVDAFIYVSCWRGGRENEWRGHLHAPSLVAAMDQIIAICEEK